MEGCADGTVFGSFGLEVSPTFDPEGGYESSVGAPGKVKIKGRKREKKAIGSGQ